MTKTLKDLSYFDSSKIDGTVIPIRDGMKAKSWFDRLTTLSKVEGEFCHFNNFWTPAFAGVTGLRFFIRPSGLEF